MFKSGDLFTIKQDHATEYGSDVEAISLEGLVQLNPDHIFMQIGFVPDSDTEAQQRYQEITNSAEWNKISAV